MPEYDLTPAAEKAIEWIKSLEKKEFVGTESRLLLIFQMLRDLVQATEQDPEKRVDEFTRRKQEIEKEIAKVRQVLGSHYDTRQIKENFWHLEEEIRRLMFDFREVEENFRDLDRQTREHIATSSLMKAEVLDKIFQEQESIEQSEQGRSFTAFWQFIMSISRQSEMEKNISRLLELAELQAYQALSSMQNLKYNLLDAGDKVKRTLSSINEQLRSFLQERKWLKNRRVLDIIRGIEAQAIRARNDLGNPRHWHKIPEARPQIELPMERSLYTPKMEQVALPDNLVAGLGRAPDALFHSFYIDEQKLRFHIRQGLAQKDQITLKEISLLFSDFMKIEQQASLFLAELKNQGQVLSQLRDSSKSQMRQHLQRMIDNLSEQNRRRGQRVSSQMQSFKDRYALELFDKLNLQLLIVTPLQKIHIIENYVNYIHFVFQEQNQSQLAAMSIQEYKEKSAQS